MTDQELIQTLRCCGRSEEKAEVRPELRKAVKLLGENYERGVNSGYVDNPAAWALYQTWKQIDGGADNG